LPNVDEVVSPRPRIFRLCWWLKLLSLSTCSCCRWYLSSGNQFFIRWKQQDQIILSALLSSLSMEVLHLVVDCQTSSSIWRTLE
jgi:hypothetical protein